MKTKNEIIIESLNDYIGFLFAYSKDLEGKLEELDAIIDNVQDKTPEEFHGECVAYQINNSNNQIANC